MSTTSSLKKQFILNTLMPYLLDPEIMGYNKEQKSCLYLTKDGKKCAVGKHMRPGPWQHHPGSFAAMISGGPCTMEAILTEEAFNANLSVREWTCIQRVHDDIREPRELLIQKVEDLEEVSGEDFGEMIELTLDTYEENN